MSSIPSFQNNMGYKFPSGKVSISIQDLRENNKSQLACGVCNKLWIIRSDGCIKSQLHVLHPCQHLVGSGCWSSVPDEIKDKCPVCKVEIHCDEKVRVQSANVNGGPASLNPNGQASALQLSCAEAFALGKIPNDRQALNLRVRNELEDGLKYVDIRAIMFYMNLRARLHDVKESLRVLLAQANTKTPTVEHLERLIVFLANTPQSKRDSKHQKVEVALSAFNISGGTNFTMNDLRKALSSAEEWIKEHFSEILMENAWTNKDAFEVRQLEKQLAEIEAKLKELKDRQSRESAQRLKHQIELAIEEIGKRADKQMKGVFDLANAENSYRRAKANDEILRINAKVQEDDTKTLAKATEESLKTRAKAREDVEKLRKHVW